MKKNIFNEDYNTFDNASSTEPLPRFPNNTCLNIYNMDYIWSGWFFTF